MSGSNNKNKLLYLFIPDHINNPVDLTKRLLATKNKSARFTLWLTALGVLTSPIDWLLSKLIKQKHLSGDETGPHIFVCGPARSGTTFVYQVLSQHTNVTYIRNLSALLPRSSSLATRLCSVLYRSSKNASQQSYENYYGKTPGFAAPSEANFLWNQWVTPDKSQFRTILTKEGAEKLSSYFGFLSKSTKMPTLAKNNNANVFADKIIKTLPNSYFICLNRQPEYLAQSLIRARLEINGNLNQSYGVTDVNAAYLEEDPFDAVLDQIEYLESTAVEQQKIVGKDRFWIIDYEDFCANPTRLINRVRTEILTQSPIQMPLRSFTSSNQVVDEDIFERVMHTINSRQQSIKATGTHGNLIARHRSTRD